MFGSKADFNSLSETQKSQEYARIIESEGKSNSQVNLRMSKLSHAAKGLIVQSDVWTRCTCMRVIRRICWRSFGGMGNRKLVEIKMEQVSTLSLSEVSEATDTTQARSEVLIGGNSTGIIIPGKVLEAAIRVDDRHYLLFITDDIIYEEMLTLLLLDLSQGVIEELTIGAAYSSGYFEDLKVSPHSASFRFIGDTTWTVIVSLSPTFKLPFSDPRGVNRPMGLRKYIDISANPAPARADNS